MSDKNSKSIVKTVTSVSGIVVLSKILGLIKQMVTANAFGATIQTDIISLSEGLVSNTDYLLVQALATAFIPTYIFSKASGKDESDRFVSNTIIVFLIITCGISALFALGSPLIARILAPSYSAELSNRLSSYIRVLSPVVIIIVEMAIFNALLKANERFLPGELISINQSFIIIVLVISLGAKNGPDILIVSFFLYAVINLIILVICSRKYWRIVRKGKLIDQNVKKLLLMMGPLLIGHAMVFINQQVDKVIVSGLEEGTVTAMGYASVLSNFICTFIGSIAGILFTYITQRIAEEDDEAAASLTTKSIIILITLLLPISMLTVANSNDIVQIVFGRGKFDANAISICSSALIGYGLMFVPYVMREIFSRVQFAYGDSKRPMINSSIAIIVNIVLSVVLSRIIGILGVTLATTVSVLVCAVLNLFSSRQKNSYLAFRAYVKYLPQWCIGGGACILLSWVGKNVGSNWHPLLRFSLITAVSFIVYLIITFSILKPYITIILLKRRG